MNPVAFGGIGLAAGAAAGAVGQRIGNHVQAPKWEARERDSARVPSDIADRLGKPNGSVAVPATLAAVGIATMGTFGSVIEAQMLQAGGESPRSMAFMGAGMVGSFAGALASRAIAGDEH